MEEKNLICIGLTLALRTTRMFEDLDYLEYNDDSETVLVKFKKWRIKSNRSRGRQRLRHDQRRCESHWRISL